MKAMNIAAALLAATLMTGVSFAQAAGSSETQQQQTAPTQKGHKHRQPPTPEQRLQHLTKKLNLTQDQQAKIKPILEKEQAQMQSIHQDTSLTKEQRRAKAKDTFKDFDGQIRAELNPDQQAKFDQMREKQKENMKKHHKGGEAAPAPQS